MGMPAVSAPDIEGDRLRRLGELVAAQGPGWEDLYRPGTFGCHELLDKTSVAASIVEQFVLSHPSCVRDPEWFALAERAAAALGELYQRVGEAHLDDEAEGRGPRTEDH
jgi:hypothetical protein